MKNNEARASGICFVTNEPALLIGDALVISELHIGYEQKLFPNTDVFFTQKLIARVAALITQTHAKRLIINGDVKHSVKGTTIEEQRELAKFFNSFSIPITIIKGNHDGDIERFIHNDDVEIVDSSGILLNNIGIIHGNAWPSREICENADTLVVGHTHPVVSLGGRRMKCWLEGRLKAKAKARFKNWRTMRVILMPAFSDVVGGACVNCAKGKKKDRLLGPLLKHEMFTLDDAQVYLLDGTEVSRVKDLRF